MNVRFVITLLVLWPFLVMADVKWHKFAVSEGDRETLTIGAVSVTISVRHVKDAWWPEDNLILTVCGKGRSTNELVFTSSYGFGDVAVEGDILLLKYGVGRGTAGARVERIKAISLSHSFENSLDELFDVQTTYWAGSRDPKMASPDLIEYNIKIEKNRDYTTFTFWTRDTGRGFPSQKIVRLKNDG
jgi:hypothetical protein